MPVKPDLDVVVPESLGRVHFIGIGGSGMSGIAAMMADAGLVVTGSDREEGPYLAGLRARGIEVSVGHDAANLGDANPDDGDAIVFTSAIWPENPEYALARERGLTMLHRSQALHWLSRRRRVAAVAGAHGKTTTTAMLVQILRGLGADPSFVNGGVVRSLGTSAATGSGELFVLEADESDGSFLLYDAAVALITNVDPVHLDHYGDAEGYLDAFARFAGGAAEAVVAGEGELLDEVLGRTRLADGARILRYGEGEGVDLRVTAVEEGARVSADLVHEGRTRRVRLDVPGRHNAVNAAGAVLAAIAVGQGFEAAVDALAGFGGTKRRFEPHGQVRGVSVYDDYAHEPAEVAATLAAARSVAAGGRVIALHQPHLYSRTQRFAAEFAAAYEQNADLTVVLAVDGAREDPVPGVSGHLVVERFRDPDRVALIEDWQEAVEHVAAIARPGDLVITLSCGTVYRIIPQLLEALGGAEGR